MIVVAHWFLRKWWCAMNWHSGKDNKFVCTRLYNSEEKAYERINKRAYIDNNTIRIFRVVKYYKGFEFKHQDLDDCHRLKEAKAKLGGTK